MTKKNPYKTQKGFGLRVSYAEKALRKLALGQDRLYDSKAREEYSRVYSRPMDNCFENGDGDAVVWALMHKAEQEPDVYGQSLLTQGIRMFLNPHGLAQWQEIYNKP